MSEISSVVAKFRCISTAKFDFGYDSHQVQANFNAEYGKEGENKDFTDATPSGTIQINIADGKPAAAFLKPGKKYYVTFTEAPE